MPSDQEDSPVRKALRQHLLRSMNGTGEDRRVNWLDFVTASPADTPDSEKLVREYSDLPFSDLKALHEHSQQAKRSYFRLLKAAAWGDLNVDDETLKQRWAQFCHLVVRSEVVDQLLTSATIHGPANYKADARKLDGQLKSTTESGRIGKRDTMEEIAAKILEVLDRRPAEWPEKNNELLSEVDNLRGVEDRTTYRYLHEKMGKDKPDKMVDWKEWANAIV